MSDQHFTSEKPCRRGHFLRYVKNPHICVECLKIRRKPYVRDKEKRAANRRKNRHNSVIPFMLKRARLRAAKKNLPFELTAAHLHPLPTHCPICGVLLHLHGGEDRTDWPTLDRIDNQKGYVPTNVAVICFLCNARKRDSSLADLEQIVSWLKKVLPNTDKAVN